MNIFILASYVFLFEEKKKETYFIKMKNYWIEIRKKKQGGYRVIWKEKTHVPHLQTNYSVFLFQHWFPSFFLTTTEILYVYILH
jgi:hypothetical protein